MDDATYERIADLEYDLEEAHKEIKLLAGLLSEAKEELRAAKASDAEVREAYRFFTTAMRSYYGR